MIVFSWRNMVLDTDGTKLYGIDKFNIQEGLNTTEKTSGKQAYSAMKTIKAGVFKFSVKLMRGCGIDIEPTVKAWRDLADGQGARAYFGGNDIFGANVMLTDISVSISDITPKGEIVECTVSLTFTMSGAAKSASTKTTSNTKVKSKNGKSPTVPAKTPVAHRPVIGVGGGLAISGNIPR